MTTVPCSLYLKHLLLKAACITLFFVMEGRSVTVGRSQILPVRKFARTLFDHSYTVKSEWVDYSCIYWQNSCLKTEYWHLMAMFCSWFETSQVQSAQIHTATILSLCNHKGCWVSCRYLGTVARDSSLVKDHFCSGNPATGKGHEISCCSSCVSWTVTKPLSSSSTYKSCHTVTSALCHHCWYP